MAPKETEIWTTMINNKKMLSHDVKLLAGVTSQRGTRLKLYENNCAPET
jgi:hypothetical protein